MPLPSPLTPTYPLINGITWSFQSIQVVVRGAPYFGVTSINYSAELKPDEARGTPAMPLGYGLGKGTVTADVEMNKQWAQMLIATLGPGFGSVPFDIIVKYGETGLVTTDSVIGCRITKVEDSHSDGIIKQKLTLQPAQILYAGIDLVPIGR